jgi:indole-3-glycerol phosphate synthase
MQAPITNRLRQICADKYAHIAANKLRLPQMELENLALAAPAPRGFYRALQEKAQQGEFALIAEIKRASPSKGLIREDFDPSALARAYKEGGACCLSVLTDSPYFMGEDSHLPAARQAVDLPVLRKDFILDPYQIIEARALGADAILLIMAALTDSQAQNLLASAKQWGMDILVEVHDADEMARALLLDTPLIGINNRNLKTLEIDLQTSLTLAPLLPADKLLVAESGITGHQDLLRLRNGGAKAFLVGETLMRQKDVRAATQALLRGKLTHFDAQGRPQMVDISAKAPSQRHALARAIVTMQPTTLEALQTGTLYKGNALQVAELAGIMGAKRTAELIPLCHPLPLTAVNLTITPLQSGDGVEIIAQTKVTATTGVEMEALTAVSIAALTLYDMAKALDRSLVIKEICLLEKTGGRSGDFKKESG